MSEPNPIYYCNTDQQYFRSRDAVSKKPHELPFCPHCGERLLPVSARQLYNVLERMRWRLRQAEERAERAERERDELRRELEKALDIIDRGCNALQDSICVSGNDPQTNLVWVNLMQKEARRLAGEG
jgi:hypothetical protein